MIRAMLLLSNLTCPNCAADLEKAVKQLNGVKEASVSFGTATLEVTYDPDLVSWDGLESLIESFGLGVAARL